MLRKLLPLFLAAATPVLIALPLLGQDTRTVKEPVFPPVCTVLPAQMAIVASGPASETTPDTSRIQAALTACGAGNAVELAGAGSNYAFLSAPLNIPSGVSLIVDGGVTLFASRNREDYQTSPVSASTDECGTDGVNGNGCKNFLLFNNNSTNANSGLYGYGVIDGRGYATTFKGGVDTGISWWVNADSYGAGQSQNNPIMMKLSKSTNFTLYKITLRNSPEFHVGWSGTGFTAWGVKIQAPWTAHNTDGIDPVGSNVTITNASISNGDDQIAVGASSPSSNITIQNSTLYSGHGLSVGSYTQGGLTNMLVQNVNMAGQPGDGNEDGIRLKSALDRGGLLKNLTYQNMCLRDVRKALYLTPYYNTNAGTLYPQFTGITFNNIHVLAPTGNYANTFSIQGYDATHQSTVALNNVVYDSLTASNTVANYTTFALSGNVSPAFLQSQTGTGVAYTGSATATPTPAYDCTAAGTFPYEVGELYLSTPAATNLQTAAMTTAGTVTLNAMLQPAKSTQSYTGTAGSYTGAALMTQPVQFLEGLTVLGTATLAANGTLASLALTGVKAGTHTYTASYPGDTNYAPLAFGSVTVNVTQAAAATTTTTLLSSQQLTSYGSSVVLTATLASSSAGTPSGSIQFSDGATVLATVPLAGSSASTTQLLPVGIRVLTAMYLGDGSFAPSASNTVQVSVAKSDSSVTLSASPTAVAFGAGTTFSGSVARQTVGNAPTGSVTITRTDNPYTGTLAATATLDANGNYTVPFTPTQTGTAVYSASYSGDSNYNSSTSSPSAITLTVKATSVTTLKVAGNTFGSATTFTSTTTAAPTPAVTVAPAGSFSIQESNSSLPTPPTGAINSSIQAVYPTAGTHTVVASYPGDINFSTSLSAPVTFVVAQASPGFYVVSSATTISAGGSISFTPFVTGVVGVTTPTGRVTLSEGSTLLGAGNATSANNGAVFLVTIPFTTPGAHTLTAVYSGDNNYTALTTTTIITVTGPPTFALTVFQNSQTLGPGVSTTSTATITPANGFNAQVTLTCSSPVAYITCTPTTQTVPVNGPVAQPLTIAVAATVAATGTPPLPLPPAAWLAGLFPLSLLGFRRYGKRWQRGLWQRGSLGALLLALSLAAISGCGSTSTTPSGPKLPPIGTQTLTITATGGGTTQTATVAVNVVN